MIWGTSYKKRDAELNKITSCFAWFPIRLESGRWVWLQRVKCHYWTSVSGDSVYWLYNPLPKSAEEQNEKI